jgi:CheY-like chemotaxis protein
MYNIDFGSDNKRENDNKKLNILIVDDDINSGESLRDLIKIRGHDVVLIDEGMKCINRCYENTFDIIFMDYHINDPVDNMNGNEITKLIRECFDINTSIYAYTGDNSNKALEEFKNNKLNGVFIKPVSPMLINEFFEIIELKYNISKLSKLARKNKSFIVFKK